MRLLASSRDFFGRVRLLDISLSSRDTQLFPWRRRKATDCAIVIQLGDYKMMSYLNSMMGLTELVIPPKPDGYASRRELSEAVEAALDAPLPAHAVEMFKLVRERFPRETDAWLSIYSGGMPWFGRPATEPLKTMDEIARMGVRDFYMDQCCDAVVVTEVTEDTVTALCDYGS